MINEISKRMYPDIWDELIDDPFGESYHEHRRQSNYYTRSLFKINDEIAPNNPEIHGFWESETYIEDYEYGNDHEIEFLWRVEEVEVTTKEWRRIKVRS